MKAIANATKENVLSFVRLCMIAPPVRFPFWSVERLADFFRTIVRLPPITNCPSAVGRYGPELRTDVKIIRGRYHAPASTPLRKLSLIEIAERCRRLSMGAQGLRTTFRTSRRGGPPHQSPPCTRSIAAALGFFVLTKANGQTQIHRRR